MPETPAPRGHRASPAHCSAAPLFLVHGGELRLGAPAALLLLWLVPGHPSAAGRRKCETFCAPFPLISATSVLHAAVIGEKRW